MPNYKIYIENRYETWKIFKDDTFDNVDYDIDPMKENYLVMMYLMTIMVLK